MSKQNRSVLHYAKAKYIPGMHIKIISVNQRRTYIPSDVEGVVKYVDTCGRVYVSIESDTNVQKIVTLYPDKDLFVVIEGGV